MTQERLASRRKFFARIAGTTDRGKLATLRRNAGNTLEDSRNALWCYQLISQHFNASQEAPLRNRQENIFFLTACLAATDKKFMASASILEDAGQEGDGGDPTTGVGDYGGSFSELKRKSGPDNKSVEHRFSVLLDSQFDTTGAGELAYRLRQTTKLMLANEVRIDWPMLLDDLLRWEVPGKPVQKSWARSYWTPEP